MKKTAQTLYQLRIYAHPVFWCGLAAAIIGGVLHICCKCSVAAADFVNYYLGGAVRIFLCKLTVWLPNSLAECLVLLLPFILAALFVHAYRVSWSNRASWRFMSLLLGVLFTVYALFVCTFASAYNASTIDSKFSLEQREVSAQELYETMQWTVAQTNALSAEIDYIYGGFSVMHETYDSMNQKIMQAYDSLREEYPFFIPFRSRTKPVIFSEAMSYTHLTGIYTFFTGEANINTAFPDYTIPFTAAHELAHQRGVARENEANFVAFQALLHSDDLYLQYSAYLNMTEYLASALAEADYDLFAQAYSQLSAPVQYEIQSYNAFFEKYADSAAADVAGAVNDTYLKASGQQAGTKSYGLVVDLAVSYYYSVISP